MLSQSFSKVLNLIPGPEYKCPYEEIDTVKGLFIWPESLAGDTKRVKCPYQYYEGSPETTGSEVPRRRREALVQFATRKWFVF